MAESGKPIYLRKKIRKVLLIFPPTTFHRGGVKHCCPPLGIAYLGAALKHDFDVALLDASVWGYNNEAAVNEHLIRYGLSFEKIEGKIRELSPDAVVISCLFSSQWPAARRICKLVKEINQDIITLTGGTHPTFLPGECMDDKNINFIVLGEGEKTIKDLLTRINSGESFQDIDGLAFRKNGKIKINPKTKFIGNIDNLPYPARELLPMEKYFEINLPMGVITKRRPQTTIMTSRGCLARCTFCSSAKFWGNFYRARSADNVLGEIEYLTNEYGIREIKFLDDNLTLDKDRAKKIFSGMIERKFKLSWNTPNGIALWTLDDELLGLMKESGCYELTLAIESGDQEVLNRIVKKPINLKSVRSIVRRIKEYGIDTYGFFIIGFPGETRKEVERTFKFADSLKLDRISAFIANPLPGTEMLEICKKRGYVDRGYKFEEADYFRAGLASAEFKSGELERIRRIWFFKYNLNLFIRHPLKFIVKYKEFLINNPKLIIGLLYKKIIGRG